MENFEKSDAVLIKRYANRKLYDTQESRYVTLNEIATMVKNGVAVKIVDYKTTKDITTVTLAQILFEEEKVDKKLSSSALSKFIQTGGEAIQDFFSKTVNLGAFREEAEKTVESFEKLFSKKILTREEGKSLVAEVFKTSQHNFEELQKRVDDRIRGVLGPAASFSLLRKEIETLNAEMEVLKARINHLERVAEGRGTAVPPAFAGRGRPPSDGDEA